MPVAALGADPLPERQVLGLRILVSTAAAQLAAGVESPHLYQLLLPGGLVAQLPGQLTPGGIGNHLGQLVVGHHALDIEALYADDVIGPDQLSGQLVQIILPAVGDILMLAGQAETGLLPVAAALWFSGQPALEHDEPLLCLLQVLGVTEFLTVAGDYQIFDAHIQASDGAGTGHLRDVYFRTAQAHKELAATAHADGCMKDSPLYRCRDPSLYPAQLRKPDRLIRCLNVLSNDLAGVAGTAVMLGLELGEANLSLALAAGEEVFVGLVHLQYRGLQGGRVHFFEPGVGAFQPRQQLHAVIAAECLPSSVGISAGSQGLVVNEADASKGFTHQLFLCSVGVQAKFVGFLHR